MKSTLTIAALAVLAACSTKQNETPSNLPEWEPGQLDIHFIYTGRGESNFMIMPDGTTMLIDAGDWDPKTYPMMCEALPDSSLRAGEWISRYIDRINPNKGVIDYLMVSHFHNDHMGDARNPAPMTLDRNPDYVLTGIARVGEDFVFRHVFDRGYPDYNYPLEISDMHTQNYLAFVKWQKENKGLQQERFIPGMLNQISLLHNPKDYEGTFSIRNLSANGEIWTGDNDSTVRCYDMNPKNLESKNENTRSIAIRVDYGTFSFYTGGDTSGSLRDADGNKFAVDSLVAAACGEVDVCKTNHHGYLDSMTKGFLDNIRARQYVMAVWDWQHTQPSVISRIVETRAHEEEPLVFYGNIPDTLQQAYSPEPWFNSICPYYGHIVVRVDKGGKQYRIYVIDASDESMRILGSYGPYESL